MSFYKACENKNKFIEKKISICKTYANKAYFNVPLL